MSKFRNWSEVVFVALVINSRCVLLTKYAKLALAIIVSIVIWVQFAPWR